MRTIKLPSGEQVSAIGQGTWYMGDRKGEATREIAALQLGIDLGMTRKCTPMAAPNGSSRRRSPAGAIRYSSSAKCIRTTPPAPACRRRASAA